MCRLPVRLLHLCRLCCRLRRRGPAACEQRLEVRAPTRRHRRRQVDSRAIAALKLPVGQRCQCRRRTHDKGGQPLSMRARRRVHPVQRRQPEQHAGDGARREATCTAHQLRWKTRGRGRGSNRQ
eukprot:355814-Chlamydomonas_euryale.AAC.8